MRNQLHIISTGKQSIEEFVGIISVIHPYVDFIHLREKSRSAREIIEIVNCLKIKGVEKSKIIINDRADIAFLKKCYGVHVGFHSFTASEIKSSFVGMKVGCSVHSLPEAMKAEKENADYVIYGHIFDTKSKPSMKPRGLNNLVYIVKSTNIPVIAIGGIKPNDVKAVLDCGADGVAIMSGVLEAPNPLKKVKEYRKQLSS
ncbi:thiazole tautomerase TenI [Aquibacillus rhizosphaerae]|uniref:Thiazole tautomerase TenI n=1 Tax=Aquibacillus rhizosphaerae TaxID=3051431 RepID=A0ABT7L190_9BACI|nr:thiazole tautomerase TenI [Aquibacillus sp. LR5S19]MDL4839619.1 thiazole tautomerase TenI [Aquibacillus sp. LR5S19]